MSKMARYLKTERGALTGLGACVFAVCLVLATGFYFLVKTASETGDAALLDISRHRAEIAQGPAKREAFLSLNRAMREQPGAVGGETLPLAAAKLDGDVKAMLQEQGADVRSSQILPAGKEKGFETIAIEYDFIIAMEKLEPLLYALQTHNPFLFAENATIAGEDDAGDDKAKPLHLHIVLRAYRWAGHQW